MAILGTTTTSQDSLGNIVVHNEAAQKAAIAFISIYIFLLCRVLGTYCMVCWPSTLTICFIRNRCLINTFDIFRLVTGEIFPLKIRAKSLSMTTATNWLLNRAIAYSTPFLVDYGPGDANLQSKIFFVWGGCCFICIAFVYFMIYETKGLTLE